jgi:hypothetical protein
MASSNTAAQATERHRRFQGSLAVMVVRDVLALWSRLDPFRLADTVPAWLAVTRARIGRHRAASEMRASDYYRQFRTLEGVHNELPRLDPHDPTWGDRRDRSLLVLGPSVIKRLTGFGMDPRDAADKAAPAVAAASVRHALNGGRFVIDSLTRSDPAAWGYQRVTDGNPCAFCAMLASRGAVFLTAESASRTLRDGKPEKYHDGCNCQPEPVFRPDTALPVGAQRFADLWETSTAGLSGKAARNAFRRAYNAQRTTT